MPCRQGLMARSDGKAGFSDDSSSRVGAFSRKTLLAPKGFTNLYEGHGQMSV